MHRHSRIPQLAFAFPASPLSAATHAQVQDAPRWTFSRLVVRSRHHKRIVERLERARPHFPELDGLAIRVGLVKKRGILGWGSLDPEQPGIWVRPLRLDLFTLAHEFTHLLQARTLVPSGERACDLYALARAPELIDHMPSYLIIPDMLRRLDAVPMVLQHQLCGAARCRWCCSINFAARRGPQSRRARQAIDATFNASKPSCARRASATAWHPPSPQRPTPNSTTKTSP